MIDYILSNMGTIVVSIILLVIVALVVKKMIKDRKRKKNGCNGDCSCCRGC